LHAAGGSLTAVISAGPAWWTPTAKAEADVGIAHGLGLLYGGPKAGNVLFDGGGRIQIADFRPMRRGGGSSRERWSPQADVSAFAMLLFEIVAGRPWPPPPPPPRAAKAAGEGILPPDVPRFVSALIERELWRIPWGGFSFIDIFESLKANGFGIVAGVDTDRVSAFVSRVESAEQSGESE
jgi:hypothetical protein